MMFFRNRTLKAAKHAARKAGCTKILSERYVALPKIGNRSVMHPWTGWIVRAR